MKTGDVARLLSVHPNTIRNWSNEFARFMSPAGQSSAPGGKREFDASDVRVFATINDLRNRQGLIAEQVTAALDAGTRADELPTMPTAAETEARAGVALVPMPTYEAALDTVQRLKQEVDRVIAERDDAASKRDADAERYNARIAELERDLGRAQGQLETIQRERLPTRVVMQIVIAVAVAAVIVVLIAVIVIARPG